AEAAAVDDVGVARKGNVVVALVAAHRIPVAEGELAVIAAARHRHRAAVLLAAVDPVGETVVGGHVVELPGRLVVPGAPGLAAVDGDDGALIGAGDHPLRVVRIDPQEVVVVAARRAAEEGEGLAAVGRAPQRLARHVDHIGILGIHLHHGEVRAGEARRGIDALPGGAAVVGTVDPGICDGVDGGIDARAAAAARYGETDASQRSGGQAVAGEPRPGLAAVGRFVDAAPRPDARHVVGLPGIVAHLPGGGEDGVRRR